MSFIIHAVVQPRGGGGGGAVDNEFVAHMKDIWRLAIYFSTLGDKEKIKVKQRSLLFWGYTENIITQNPICVIAIVISLFSFLMSDVFTLAVWFSWLFWSGPVNDTFNPISPRIHIGHVYMHFVSN